MDHETVRIALIGDSLTLRADGTSGDRDTATRDKFAQADFTNDYIYRWARGGKGLVATDGGGKTTMQNIADAKALLGTVDVWVIALGTNNSGDTDSEFVANVNTVLDAIDTAGGGMVLWVNLAFWGPGNTNSMRLNPLLTSTVGGRGGTVLDWHQYIHTSRVDTDWIYPTDSTHMTPAGYAKRDSFIIAAITSAIASPPARGDGSTLYLGRSGEYVPLSLYVGAAGEYMEI